MSHINMAGMNGGNGVMAGVPMMNNGMNGATPRPVGEQDDNDYQARLHAYIYDYFVKSEQFECARVLCSSGVTFLPPLRQNNDVNGADDNAMHTDAKDDPDSKRPDDLPPPSVQSEGQGTSFLLEWFGLFWDVFHAQRKNPKASQHASQYIQHTQTQSRLRAEQQQALLQGTMRPMMPGSLNEQQQMLRMQQAYGMHMNGDLRKNAMNNRGGFNQATPQQLAQMKQAQLLQQQMRRDPSDMDVNGQRPRTPSSGDNAPSPSKRPRLEGAPFNGQMMPNGRGPLQGMQGQQMMDMNANQANQMLVKNGINPEQLSQDQFASFQAQNPQIQQKSIQVYAQNLARNQRQGMPRQGMAGQDSPMMQPGFDMGPQEMYNQQLMRAVPGGPNGANGGNHALQDYQMQLMLLEQQNKKRLLMARQEQDNVGRDGQPMPGGPGGFAPGMSPGSRSGPSPEPGQMKRGTPKMGPAGLPTSPMPDNMPQRSPPAAMGFAGQMPPEMYQNGMTVPPNGMRMAPSSHPGQFGGQPFNPAAQAAQMEALRAQGRLPNGANWPQGPQGQAPMMQPTQAPQPQPMGTPQQRNDMPPPPAVQPGAGTNGRPSPPAQPAPPTPQPGNKPNPKKKDTEKTRKRPPKKGSSASVAATPSGEAEAPPTPTPATPTIPRHPSSFNAEQKVEALAQPTVAPAPAPAPVQNIPPPQPDLNPMQQYEIGNPEGQFSMNFGGLENPDVLDNFDFDSFLQSNDEFPEFDPTGLSFGAPEGVETGADGA